MKALICIRTLQCEQASTSMRDYDQVLALVQELKSRKPRSVLP